jgi:hypothetical protein
MVFSDLWVRWAVKTTLAPKFGGPAQKWGRVGLGKGGIGWNPGPPFSPLTPPSSSLPLGLGGREGLISRPTSHGCSQGCHKGRFWMKMSVRTSARVRIYPRTR